MSSNVTLKEIAMELGLSMMTVSRAINNKKNVDAETKKKVLEKAESMGYTPNYLAKSLVSRKTQTIGLVVPEISHSFFPEVLKGVEEVTYQKDYQLILTHSAEQFEREKKAIETLKAMRVDGIMISCSQEAPDMEFYHQLKKSKIPIVFFDRCIEGIGFSCVSVDDKDGARKITQHLIDHGINKIGHLAGPQKVSLGKKRLDGYLEALKDNNIEINEKWIIEAGMHERYGHSAMKTILSLPREEWPRAVFAVNDPAAFGAIDAIKEHGLKIPDDIAVVGFSDDIRAELLEVPLTTVHQPAFEIGRKAAEKLIGIINGEEEAGNIEIETVVKFRSSCGCSYIH